MGEEEKQFNVQLPKSLIAGLKRYTVDRVEEIAKAIKTKDVLAQALFFYLGPFGCLSFRDAVWKAKVDKAQIRLRKKVEGEFCEIVITSEDMAMIIRAFRDAVEGEGLCLTSQQ